MTTSLCDGIDETAGIGIKISEIFAGFEDNPG